jgi:hypothetical protein
MAFSAIAYIAPNFRDFKNDWLKAYEPGTTTPKVMALDSSGSPTVAKLQLNADGFIESAGGALVIPYIEDSYDLWLFPTEAEADANDTSSAERLADNINSLNTSLINDPSQSYEFDGYQAMIANAGSVQLPDRKKASTGTGQWRVVTTVTTHVIANTSPQLYAFPLNGLHIEDFGAVEGANSSVAIRLAISVSNGVVVRVPSKRYLYDRVAITDDKVRLIGALNPNIKSDYTTLENGSIIQGTMIFSGKNVTVKNLGYDLGSATSEADGDGLKCSTTLNAGVNLCIDGVTTLLPAFDTAQHSMLLESYTKCYLNNITTGHGDFGLVIKCSNITGGNFNHSRNRLAGFYPKSDPSFGTAENINLSNVIVDGNESQQAGVLIQTDDVEINNLTLSGFTIKNCDYPVFIDAALTASAPINDVTLTDFILDKPLIRGVWSRAANAGIVKSLTLNNFTVKDIGFQSPDDGVNTRAAYFEGDHKLLRINGMDAIPNFGTSTIALSDFIHVDTAVKTTIFNDINIATDYDGTSESARGYINYLNSSTYNKIGIYRAFLKGVGVPNEGYLNETLATGNQTADVPFNTIETRSTLKISGAAGTIITAFEDEIIAGLDFPVGYMITVINGSGNNLQVNNGFPNILNDATANVTILPNEARQWIYIGPAWHQVT